MGTIKSGIGKLGFLSLFILILTIISCDSNKTFEGIHKRAVCRHMKVYQKGIATYYGKGFEYRHTASGQIYRKESFTAAHRTLPLGSIIRVKNLENNREVIILVNDRGPVKKTLAIDLSQVAAIHLNMIHKGSAPVEIEVLSSSPNPMKKIFDVYRNLPYCR